LLDPVFVALERLEGGFGFFGLIPEIGGQRCLFEVGYFKTSFIDVKDTSLTRPLGFAGPLIDPES
jgi:hypothetical protein